MLSRIVRPTTPVKSSSFQQLKFMTNKILFNELDTEYKAHKLLNDFHLIKGVVKKGYGRGSKTLGFPTANFPQFEKEILKNNLTNGIYYGIASVRDDDIVQYCVANIGYSPTFEGQVSRLHC
jgi:FAD synthase